LELEQLDLLGVELELEEAEAEESSREVELLAQQLLFHPRFHPLYPRLYLHPTLLETVWVARIPFLALSSAEFCPHDHVVKLYC